MLYFDVFFPSFTGYSVTCCASYSFIDCMGPNEMVKWSNEFAFSCIRLQLRHVADWNGDCLTIPHLHNLSWSWSELQRLLFANILFQWNFLVSLLQIKFKYSSFYYEIIIERLLHNMMKIMKSQVSFFIFIECIVLH